MQNHVQLLTAVRGTYIPCVYDSTSGNRNVRLDAADDWILWFCDCDEPMPDNMRVRVLSADKEEAEAIFAEASNNDGIPYDGGDDRREWFVIEISRHVHGTKYEWTRLYVPKGGW